MENSGKISLVRYAMEEKVGIDRGWRVRLEFSSAALQWGWKERVYTVKFAQSRTKAFRGYVAWLSRLNGTPGRKSESKGGEKKNEWFFQ